LFEAQVRAKVLNNAPELFGGLRDVSCLNFDAEFSKERFHFGSQGVHLFERKADLSLPIFGPRSRTVESFRSEICREK